jgi:fucose permease
MATFFLILIYLTFISLGLPDALLGSAWPVMRLELGASLDTAGIIFVIISGGTILSSFVSGWVVGRLGTGKVTAVSVLLTAAALLGISFSPSIWLILLIGVPLGLGAGSVDAALNHYVALHYESRHMSWLHCFWGVGALTGPLIIGAHLRQGNNWRGAYLTLGIIQGIVCLVLFVSLPLWNRFADSNKGKKQGAGDESKSSETVSTEPAEIPAGALPEKKVNVLFIPGVIQALITFFLYCATEYTVGLWGASFLSELRGFTKAAAATAIAMYYTGITVGRFFAGFLTMKFTGTQLIRAGLGIVTTGAVLLLLPLPGPFALAALRLIGFGCSPVYPSMIQLTPKRCGAENSQKIIGMQMGCAYTGATVVPPLIGVVLANTHMLVLPAVLVFYGVAMFFTSEWINRKCKAGS